MKYLVKFLIAVLLSSCASTNLIKLGNETAVKGTEISQKALNIFDLLSQQTDIDKSQQDRINILTNPDPKTMTLPDTKTERFSTQIETRVKAYQSLLNTYRAFALLTGNQYGVKTQETSSILLKSYNSIEKLPDLPAQIVSKLPALQEKITQAIQAKKIRKHSEILFNLTQFYVLLWNEDQKIWNQYIDVIYDNHVSALNTVAMEKYDSKKIFENSKEPYDEYTAVLFYRLQQREEIVKRKNEIKTQICRFEKALAELHAIHAELSKSKPNTAEVIIKLDAIEKLLK